MKQKFISCGIIFVGTAVVFAILGSIIQIISKDFFLSNRLIILIFSLAAMLAVTIKRYNFHPSMLIPAALILAIFGRQILLPPAAAPAHDPALEVKQTESPKEKKTPAGAGRYTVERDIQRVYKAAAQSAGTGFPEVDCSFAQHWQNDVYGLIYMNGEYKLSTDKATHTYTARYGSNTEDLTYLSLDGQRIYWNEEKESAYLDKYSEEHPKDAEK